jgi:hypothetical protein
LEKLDAAWQASSQEYRAYLTTTNGEYWESLRGRATEVGA